MISSASSLVLMVEMVRNVGTYAQPPTFRITTQRQRDRQRRHRAPKCRHVRGLPHHLPQRRPDLLAIALVRLRSKPARWACLTGRRCCQDSEQSRHGAAHPVVTHSGGRSGAERAGMCRNGYFVRWSLGSLEPSRPLKPPPSRQRESARTPWDSGAYGTGGAERVRTADLRLAKPALSQLSYCPILQVCAGIGSGRCPGIGRTSRGCAISGGRAVRGLVPLEAEEYGGGDEQREEGEPEDISAKLIPHLPHYGKGVSTQTDQIEDDAAQLGFFQERFAFCPRHISIAHLAGSTPLRGHPKIERAR